MKAQNCRYLILFGADKWQITTDAMGALLLKLGRDLGLTRLDEWQTALGN